MPSSQTIGRSGASADSRNGLLDLLRFTAALTVAVYHFLYRGAQEGNYLEFSFAAAGISVSLGYLGVNLFFMISGFVIIWSATGRDWYGFSVGRLARLYPAHVVAMTITFLTMLWWAQPPYTTDVFEWLANLTMLAPMFGSDFMDGAYWSIVIEIIFSSLLRQLVVDALDVEIEASELAFIGRFTVGEPIRTVLLHDRPGEGVEFAADVILASVSSAMAFTSSGMLV
jgi:peptidoglycan/LPS O-acetylase OafA/YrhL